MDDHVDELIRQIRPNFDEKAVRETYDWAVRKGAVRFFFQGIQVRDDCALQEHPRQRVYFANHQSHFDYLAAWYILASRSLPIPRFAAGKNLDLPFLRACGFDFRSLGAFFVDRDLVKSDGNGKLKKNYARALDMGFGEIISEGHDMLVFPEGGRSYDGSVMLDSSALKNTSFQKVADLTGKVDLDIVPVAFRYDERIEQDVLPMLEIFRGRRNLIQRSAYFATDIVAFFGHILKSRITDHPEGTACYVSFGRPRKLTDIVGQCEARKRWRSLRDDVAENIRSLYANIETGRDVAYDESNLFYV